MLTFHPAAGTILRCDFSGLVPPEMIKVRPVVVVSPRLRKADGLCTVVPLSTSSPRPVMPWHCLIELADSLTPAWPETRLWAKCDMLYTFRYARLDRLSRREQGRRVYFSRSLPEADLATVRACIGRYLAIG